MVVSQEKEASIKIIPCLSAAIGCFITITACQIIYDYEIHLYLFGNLSYLLLSTTLVVGAGLTQFLSSTYLLWKRDFIQRWININSYVFLMLILAVCICIPLNTSPYNKLQGRNYTTNDVGSGSGSGSRSTPGDISFITPTTPPVEEESNFPTTEIKAELEPRNLNETTIENLNSETQPKIMVDEDEKEEKFSATTMESEKNDLTQHGYDSDTVSTMILHIKLFYGIILANFLFLPISLGLMARYVEPRFRIVRSK